MKKSIVSALLVLAMLLLPALPAGAAGNEGRVVAGGVEYDLYMGFYPDGTGYQIAVAAGLSDKSLSNVSIASTVSHPDGFPFTVTAVAESAFAGETGIKSVTLPYSLEGSAGYLRTGILQNAFRGCTHLKRVVFQSPGCPNIEPGAFDKIAPGAAAEVPEGQVGSGKYDPECYPFRDGAPLSLFPDGGNPPEVFSLDGYSFETRPGLEGQVVLTAYNGEGPIINIPRTVESPEGRLYTVSAVGEGAFLFQTGLTDVFLPDTCREIGRNAFAGCSSLGSVYFMGTAAPQIAENAFSGIAPGAAANVFGPIGTGAGMYNPWAEPFRDGSPLTLV